MACILKTACRACTWLILVRVNSLFKHVSRNVAQHSRWFSLKMWYPYCSPVKVEHTSVPILQSDLVTLATHDDKNLI
jgi:hypothetical protein